MLVRKCHQTFKSSGVSLTSALDSYEWIYFWNISRPLRPLQYYINLISHLTHPVIVSGRSFWSLWSWTLDWWSDWTFNITKQIKSNSASEKAPGCQVVVRADESEYSVQSFIDRVIKLEKRSRALPRGSAQRGAARANYEEAYYEGFKECGERWANQWRKPTDYAAPMHTNFSSGTCFYNNTLDQ